MAVDVTIRGLFAEGAGERVFLGDDGYYWFMHPWFEALAVQTGQYIDLYGDAEFSMKDFDQLLAVITEVRQQVLTRPETWHVKTGWQRLHDPKEIFCQVSRTEFLRLLDELEGVIKKAYSLGERISCIGD